MAKQLTPPQIQFLLRLRRAEKHSEMTPGGDRKAALSASNWYRTGDALVAAGLATWWPAGGGKRCELTEAGVAKADELKASLERVVECETRLARAQAADTSADNRCVATPQGDPDLPRHREESIDTGHAVAEAQAELAQARKEHRAFASC